mmetsp:Transcript_56826/g.132890  ORF Transcript_56826/g.132890 Transcript_56826/m.132890 type:complete len:270 (+) Transcript_56826:70-879(+)
MAFWETSPVTIASLAVVAFAALLLCLPSFRRPGIFGLLKKYRHVVLVVAHPDDEAMFFWPALSQLRDAGVDISVLCLSTGNFDGLGQIRRDEMERSCEKIGVKGEALQVLDDAELQDGWHLWPPEAVAQKVHAFLLSRGAGAVLTFDNIGVSGHPNHISTSKGVQLAFEQSRTDATLPSFELLLLKSVELHEKYLGPLCLFSRCESACEAAAVSCSPFACLAALATHWSQLVWYRVLFATCSRYVYVNTFQRHTLQSPKDGDCASDGST